MICGVLVALLMKCCVGVYIGDIRYAGQLLVCVIIV